MNAHLTSTSSKRTAERYACLTYTCLFDLHLSDPHLSDPHLTISPTLVCLTYTCLSDLHLSDLLSLQVRNNPKRSCQFNRTMLEECSGVLDRFYGYDKGQPCILIKLNRV